MKIQKYFLHAFSISVLFTLGNTILTLPFYVGGFWQLIISSVITFTVVLFISRFMCTSLKNNIIYILVVFLLGTFSIFACFYDFINFLKTVGLPRTNIFLLVFALVFMVLFLSLSNSKAIYKYSLFVSVIVFSLFAVCFIAGIKNYDLKNISVIFSAPRFSLNVFLNLTLPVVMLPIWIKQNVNSLKPVFLGIITSYAFILICLCQVVFTLGYINAVNFPFLRAVGVISSSVLFTRLDGAIYFIFFVTTIIKITVCIKAIQTVIKNQLQNT